MFLLSMTISSRNSPEWLPLWNSLKNHLHTITKMWQMWWIGCAVLLVAPKWLPQFWFFSIAMGAEYSYYLKFFAHYFFQRITYSWTVCFLYCKVLDSHPLLFALFDLFWLKVPTCFFSSIGKTPQLRTKYCVLTFEVQ